MTDSQSDPNSVQKHLSLEINTKILLFRIKYIFDRGDLFDD